MSVSSILRETAGRFADKTAIFFEDTEISYRKLNRDVDSLARGLLDLGLNFGERVSLLLSNSADFIRSYFAITRAGGVVLPLNPLFKGEELAYILNDAQAVLMITTKTLFPVAESIRNQVPSLRKVIVIGGETTGETVSFEELLQREAEPVELAIGDEAIAACLYTSGTTGKPKGALLSHGNLTFDAYACIERVNFTAEDNFLCVLPLFHSFSQMGTMLCPVFCGGSIIVVAQFWPDTVLKQIAKRKATVFCGVPAMFRAMLTALTNGEGYDLSSLRLCFAGGAPMPAEIMRYFHEKLDVIILEGNGPTETSPVSYVNPPSKCKIGSVGLPLEGVKVKIVDEEDKELPAGEVGEICVQGPNVMQGYLNQPEATAEAMKGGWFHTGDLGKIDEEGYVYIVDRKKDMLIVGGLNVYPREVEECLYGHPKVAEAAVIGIHDEQRGEVPMAFIVLLPGQTAAPAEFSAYCREHLANFKCPRKVAIVESLPKTVTGKIDKKQLREGYSMGIIKSE